MNTEQLFRFFTQLELVLNRRGFTVTWSFVRGPLNTLSDEPYLACARLTAKQGWGGSAATLIHDFTPEYFDWLREEFGVDTMVDHTVNAMFEEPVPA